MEEGVAVSKDNGKLKPLASALEEHSAEGIDILYSQPASYMRWLIYTLFGLVIAGAAWSFFGRADVIVTATGTLAPRDDPQRVYAPIDGELIDVYVSENQHIAAGDPLARLSAPEAIQVAANAARATLERDRAEAARDRFAVEREVMELEAGLLANAITLEETLLKESSTKGRAKLAAEWDQAHNERDAAIRELAAERENLAKLREAAALGEVAEIDVIEARRRVAAAQDAVRTTRNNLRTLEARNTNEAEERARLALDQKRIELETLRLDIDRQAEQVALEFRAADVNAKAASRVNFEDLDEENFLLVRAPVTGVITQVNFTQPGDKVPAATPLLSIADESAQTVLKVNIRESDRGLIQEGQRVKLKFSAFPYQRYGTIDGTLEFVSPTTRRTGDAETPAYVGHVSLDRDYVMVGNTERPLRYGMVATAEIVIEERRLVAYLFDPMGNI